MGIFNHNDELIRPEPSRKSLEFWEEIFIYFWIFSLLGHYAEVFWSYILHIVIGAPIWHPLILTVTPIAPPYGVCAVLIIIFVYPLIKKHKLSVFETFLACTVVASISEYVCAIMLVILDGRNMYWDYSRMPFNVNGFICLQNCLLFGVAGTMFIYLIYPACEKIIRRFNKRELKILFLILFASYSFDSLTMETRKVIMTKRL